MADILCKLKLVTDNYESNLKKSRQQMQEFTKKTQDANRDFKKFESSIGAARSSFLKFAGGIGLAITAGEGFNKAINSSQTLSDEYNRTIDGLTGTVDNLFYSIANGDWSPFLQGLSNSIALAREAYTALDQLGNTKISYGYFNMKNQAEMQDQIAILRDKDSTDDQKKVARAEADRILKDQKEITEQLARRSEEAMLALVKKSTGLSDLDISQMDIEKSIRLDVSTMGDAEKTELDKLYKEFDKKASEIKTKFTTTDVNMTGGMRGASVTQSVDYTKVKEELKPLLAQYQDAILYNSTLKKESDGWLQNLVGIGEASYTANRNYSSMVKAANRASQSETGTPKKKKTEKEEPVEGSLAELDKQLAEWRKKFNDETTYEARLAADKMIKEISQKKAHLEVEIKYGKVEDVKELVSKQKVPSLAVKGKNVKEDIDSGKIKSKPTITKKDVKINNDYADSLNAISSMMGSVTDLTNESATAWASWGSNVLASVATAIPAIVALTTAKKAEATANSEATVTGAMSSVASIPVVGWIMALAAGAAVIASIAAIPKFETGGIVGANGGVIPGASFSGDKILARVNSGELILNRAQQKNIASQLVSGGGTSRVDVNVVGRISGRDLELVMEKRNQFKKRTQ